MNDEHRHALLTVVLFLLLAIAPFVWAADDLQIEAEEYVSHDAHNIGGEPIRTTFCSGASGFSAVAGIDTPGEWIELSVSFPADACYSSELFYQAAYGDTVLLDIKMLDVPVSGQEIDSRYWLTDGYGFG